MDTNMLELLKTENVAYKRKLQSKSEALHIIQSQLLSCQHELDQQRRIRNQQNFPNQQNDNDGLHTNINTWTSVDVANKKLMDENKLLQFDIEDLKQKLNDANNDITVLRKQQTMMRNSSNVTEKLSTTTSCIEHLELLEHLNRKYSQLEQDLQILLDEKQDLIKQRDIYYDKMSRLNIQIKNLLNISNQNVDFDAIVMENKYLKQRLEDILNEKKMWNKTVSKYKTMLSNNCQNTGKILSYDQIARHINTMTSSISSSGKYQQPEPNNLKQICITLLETLNEKNLLLQHQRKTNKLLAHRVLELENKFSEGQSTCDVLLKGYSAKGSNCEGFERIEAVESIKQANVQSGIANVCKDLTETCQANGDSEAINVIENTQEKVEKQCSVDSSDLESSERLCDEQSQEDSDRESRDVPHDEMNADDQVMEEIKELNRSTLDEHEDIQNLPIELQKLVLQAMKDLEKTETKG